MRLNYDSRLKTSRSDTQLLTLYNTIKYSKLPAHASDRKAEKSVHTKP